MSGNKLRVFIQYLTLDKPGWETINDLTLRTYNTLKSHNDMPDLEVSIIANGPSQEALSNLCSRLPKQVKVYRASRCLGNAIIKASEVATEEGEPYYFFMGCLTLLSKNGLQILKDEIEEKMRTIGKPVALDTTIIPYPIPAQYEYLLPQLTTVFPEPHWHHNFFMSIKETHQFCSLHYNVKVDDEGIAESKDKSSSEGACRLGIHFMATSNFVSVHPPKFVSLETGRVRPHSEDWEKGEEYRWMLESGWESENLYAKGATVDNRVATFTMRGVYIHRGIGFTKHIWGLAQQGLVK